MRSYDYGLWVVFKHSRFGGPPAPWKYGARYPFKYHTMGCSTQWYVYYHGRNLGQMYQVQDQNTYKFDRWYFEYWDQRRLMWIQIEEDVGGPVEDFRTVVLWTWNVAFWREEVRGIWGKCRKHIVKLLANDCNTLDVQTVAEWLPTSNPKIMPDDVDILTKEIKDARNLSSGVSPL